MAPSILSNSHPDVLSEIVLIDDGSTLPHLGDALERYLVQHFPGDVVRLMRNGRRLGLVGCRMAGVRATTATILTFLDSHVEAAPGWLKPLMKTIQADRQVSDAWCASISARKN